MSIEHVYVCTQVRVYVSMRVRVCVCLHECSVWSRCYTAAYHIITQNASLVLSILAEEEGHAGPLVVTQVHVDR